MPHSCARTDATGRTARFRDSSRSSGIPYTGSGVYASALAMSKTKTKQIYRLNNLPTLPSLTLRKGEGYDLDAIIEELGDHCVIKAAKEGSSIGLFIEEGKDASAHR